MEIRNNQNIPDAKLLEQQRIKYNKMTQAEKESPMGLFVLKVITELEKKLS